MENAATRVSAGSPRWLRCLAIVTACATFPLVVVGGVVTTTRVGMADPDWPTPPWYLLGQYLSGTVLDRGLGFVIEHGHRLLGWLVGLLTLALAGGLWLSERRAWLRWLGCAALAAVIVQGLLGGLRVILHNQMMGLVHGVAAQLFFAFMVCIVACTGVGWMGETASVTTRVADRLRRLSLITTVFVFAQLVFGATLRHLGYMWALVAHLFIAFAIVLHVALIAKRVFGEEAVRSRLSRLVEVLALLVLGQLMLGTAAWATSTGFGLNMTTAQSGAQMFFTTAHMSVGALILATSALLTMRCHWWLGPSSGADDHQGITSRARHSGQAEQVARPSVSALESRELWRTGVRA